MPVFRLHSAQYRDWGPIRVRTVALICLVALLVQGCGQPERGATGDCPAGGVAIGFFGALTGDNAQLAINFRNGAELAVDAYRGRCAVEIVPFDSQGDPAQAPALAARAVRDERVVALIGPTYSGEMRVTGPLFQEAGLPLVTVATNAALSRNGWQVFHRIVANDAVQGQAAAAYLARTLRAERVAVVHDSSDYGLGIAEIVSSELGGSVFFADAIDPDALDYSSTVNGLRGIAVDAIFYGGYYAEAGRLLKQLRDAGVTATFVSDDAAKDPGLIEAAGQPAAEGALVTCPCAPAEQAFMVAYTQAFGEAPGTFSAEGYDAANVLLAAIDAGSTGRESVSRFLDGVDHAGITKRIAFDAQGEVADQRIFLYEVRGGEIIPVGPTG